MLNTLQVERVGRRSERGRKEERKVWERNVNKDTTIRETDIQADRQADRRRATIGVRTIREKEQQQDQKSESKRTRESKREEEAGWWVGSPAVLVAKVPPDTVNQG